MKSIIIRCFLASMFCVASVGFLHAQQGTQQVAGKGKAQQANDDPSNLKLQHSQPGKIKEGIQASPQNATLQIASPAPVLPMGNAKNGTTTPVDKSKGVSPKAVNTSPVNKQTDEQSPDLKR